MFDLVFPAARRCACVFRVFKFSSLTLALGDLSVSMASMFGIHVGKIPPRRLLWFSTNTSQNALGGPDPRWNRTFLAEKLTEF